MQSEKSNKWSKYISWFVKRATLMLFDVAVVNASYFLALLIRFYVNGEFRAVATDEYVPAFVTFAPYYTVISLVVFVLFSLYNSRWKHAGLHDLNRIFAANLVTAAVQVAGTLLFVCRMPVTYYFIGAVLQFLMIAASRFSYRLVMLIGVGMRRMNRAKMNVMIVGVGETSRVLRRQIENDITNVARPVCIFSYKVWNGAKLMNGLPVLTGLDKLPGYLSRYQVQCVILADAIMPMDTRRAIREICQKSQVEVQDFSGYLKQSGAGLTPKMLLEYISGPVDIVIDGAVTSCENGEKALMTLQANYSVQSVSAQGDRVVVFLAPATVVLNDVHQDWVRDTEAQTGKEISFF